MSRVDGGGSWRVGEVRITKILENEMVGGLTALLPDATPEAVGKLAWMKPDFMNEAGELILSVHSFVVETPTCRILVDTCVGNDKPRPLIPAWDRMQTHFLDTLRAAGWEREDIDVVLCTHLHVDHVGWNTLRVDGAWRPTFPRARYLVARDEYDHWRGETDRGETSTPFQTMQLEVFADSVRPIVEAGLLDLVATDHQVCPEVRLTPTPGHTPGHVSVAIASVGARALITGDMIHHPCQLAHPAWTTVADSDPRGATATRRRVCEEVADTDVLVLGTHWAGASGGQITREGAAFGLCPHRGPDVGRRQHQGDGVGTTTEPGTRAI